MKLFSGTGSGKLAESIAKKLNISLGKADIVRFGDSEVKPVVKEDVRGEDVFIIQSTSAPVNETYMEFFLLVDALRRSAAKRIIAVMPYFGYARQNQQHLPGEPVSAQVMVKFIEQVGVDELVTLDLHEEQLTGFFEIPIQHLSAFPILAKEVAREVTKAEHKGKIVVVSPDQGGVERTRRFRDKLAYSLGRSALSVSGDTVVVEKHRNLETTHQTKVVEVSGEDVSGKIVVIPDDVIVSGGTIANAAKSIKRAGAISIYLCATHADFIKGTKEKLQQAPVEKLFVADTIEIKDEWRFDNINVVSVAKLLKEEIEKVHG